MPKRKKTSVEAESKALISKGFRFHGRFENTFPKSVRVVETVVKSPTESVFAVGFLPDSDARENIDSPKVLSDILSNTDEGKELVAKFGTSENAVRYLALISLRTFSRNAIARGMTNAPALSTRMREIAAKGKAYAQKIADFLNGLEDESLEDSDS